MNVVDSSGWLEYFGNGPNANFFAPVIRATDALIVPTLCLYEVHKRVIEQRGEEDALAAIAWMSAGLIVDLTKEIALNAALLSRTHKLAMADSVILATARAYDAELWTQDVHFANIEGVRYIEKK